MGREAWEKGMNPDIPETKVMDNPYTYTEYKSASTREARSSLFGDADEGAAG